MLNAKKSKNMCFGKKQNLCSLHLDGKTIEWVDSWTYLGVILKVETGHDADQDCVKLSLKKIKFLSERLLIYVIKRCNYQAMNYDQYKICLRMKDYIMKHQDNMKNRRKNE